jgi:hypothetical protein
LHADVVCLRAPSVRRSGDDPTVDELCDPVASPDQRFDARASLERAIGDDAESLTLLFRRYLDP